MRSIIFFREVILNFDVKMCNGFTFNEKSDAKSALRNNIFNIGSLSHFLQEEDR